MCLSITFQNGILFTAFVYTAKQMPLFFNAINVITRYKITQTIFNLPRNLHDLNLLSTKQSVSVNLILFARSVVYNVIFAYLAYINIAVRIISALCNTNRITNPTKFILICIFVQNKLGE